MNYKRLVTHTQILFSTPLIIVDEKSGIERNDQKPKTCKSLFDNDGDNDSNDSTKPPNIYVSKASPRRLL